MKSYVPMPISVNLLNTALVGYTPAQIANVWSSLLGEVPLLSLRGRITSGTYNGNDSANRAITHGLGAIPKFVLIFDQTNYKGLFIIPYGSHRIYSFYDTSLTVAGGWVEGLDTYREVSDPTIAEFYVGDVTQYDYSANGDGVTYVWIAFS